MPTDQEIIKCPDCRVWDPENQPSVQDNFAKDPNYYEDRMTLMVKTGASYVFGGVSIPLWADMLLCVKHQKELEDDAKT